MGVGGSKLGNVLPLLDGERGGAEDRRRRHFTPQEGQDSRAPRQGLPARGLWFPPLAREASPLSGPHRRAHARRPRSRLGSSREPHALHGRAILTSPPSTFTS